MLYLYSLPAHNAGRFEAELAPMEVKGRKGMETFSADEHPRDTTAEKLGSLKAVFKENGTVTAGNASVSGEGTSVCACVCVCVGGCMHACVCMRACMRACV